jgi:hypothetical protein
MEKSCHIHLKSYFLCDIRLLGGYRHKVGIGTLPEGGNRSYAKMHTFYEYRGLP